MTSAWRVVSTGGLPRARGIAVSDKCVPYEARSGTMTGTVMVYGFRLAQHRELPT